MQKERDLQEILKRYISKKFQTRRAELSITQTQMSERLMISDRSYSDLEHGKYLCSAKVLIAFILYCDVDKDELFSQLKEIFDEDAPDI